jgi:hypothetical protein
MAGDEHDHDAVDCHWCEARHGARYLCDPVKLYLEALVARAGSYTLPTTEFPEDPIPLPPELGDILLRQVTVMGGTGDVAGTRRPLIVISGRGADGQPLPRWVYIDTVQNIQRVRDLFNRMCSLAIDAARRR